MRHLALLLLLLTLGLPACREETTPSIGHADADAPARPGSIYLLFPDLEGDALREAVRGYAAAGQQTLSYRRAREISYWVLDNVDGDAVTIYEHARVPLPPGQWPAADDLNCEHLWPQSRGARRPPAKSDLFHIRPALPRINSIRGNMAFGTPTGAGGHEGGSGWAQGREPDGDEVFLPPGGVRGDIARSMFYFAVRYGHSIDDDEEEDLRRWHHDDPVDDAEQRRATLAGEHQGNANPFVDDPTLVDRLPDL